MIGSDRIRAKDEVSAIEYELSSLWECGRTKSSLGEVNIKISTSSLVRDLIFYPRSLIELVLKIESILANSHPTGKGRCSRSTRNQWAMMLV